MSCPKCGGFVTYISADPVAFEPDCDGIWGYFEAQCEECDWTGYGRMFYKQDEDLYEDDVKLPKEE